jgi:Flp pilus assembly protein TadG
MDVGRRTRGERGSVIVETAIILPLGMALLLGTVTAGTAYFKKISLVDAAREGARYGASLKVPDSGVSTWQSAVRERVAQISGGEIKAADVCAELVVPTGSDSTCGVADPDGAEDDPSSDDPASVVKVSVESSARLDFIFFSSSPTLSAKVAARYERDTS